MTPIDPEELEDALGRYPTQAVFARVEDDRLETLPEALRDGTYLWKDVEWIVRWYCRRPQAPHDRSAESAFKDNGMDEIRSVIDGLADYAGVRERIEALTTLAGIDVPVATAFVQFFDPASFTAMDANAWRPLWVRGALPGAYPEHVTTAEYEDFLDQCQEIAGALDWRVVDVGRALWVLGVEQQTDAHPGRHR